MKKIGLISLGCPKNRVDSEILLASFKSSGYDITLDPKDADVILINTCAFIKEASKESIDTILEMVTYNKKIIVSGCLAERYKKNLKKELPEIRTLLPFSLYQNINNELKEYGKNIEFIENNRIYSTYPGFGYLRIAEGCDNFCSFCAIPYIRGRYKSRELIDIIKDAKTMVQNGISSIEIIAQDVISYGKDLKEKTNLIDLLKTLENIEGLNHIRLLYLYPNDLIIDLVKYIKTSKKVYPYFDIPIQHCSNKLLKSMNRHFDFDKTIKLLNYIRSEIPNAIMRTSIIVGYPNEDKNDFEELKKFIIDFKFDHVGFFSYSKEEGTKAYSLPNQIRASIKKSRIEELSKIQLQISYKKYLSHINEKIIGLCIYHDSKTGYYYFLTKYNASENIDGQVFAKSKEVLTLGKDYELEVVDAFTYDLYVKVI